MPEQLHRAPGNRGEVTVQVDASPLILQGVQPTLHGRRRHAQGRVKHCLPHQQPHVRLAVAQIKFLQQSSNYVWRQLLMRRVDFMFKCNVVSPTCATEQEQSFDARQKRTGGYMI